MEDDGGGGVGGEEEEEEEKEKKDEKEEDANKAHTFRRRRLSLSNHQRSSSSPPPGDGRQHHDALEGEEKVDDDFGMERTTPSGDDDDDDDDDDLPPAQLEVAVAAAAASALGDGGERATDTDADSKAHTFRKRRLSLTNRVAAADGDDAGSHGSGSLRTSGGRHTSNHPNSLKRRLSEASGASSVHSNNGPLLTNTVHAGELFGTDHPGPPPSPALHDSVLYRYYGLGGGGGTASHPPTAVLLPPGGGANGAPPAASFSLVPPPTVQPRWKRRHVVREHSKLPFPQEIVGIFSCHGMEPVYDSDYEEEEEVEEDGDVQKLAVTGVGAGTVMMPQVTATGGQPPDIPGDFDFGGGGASSSPHSREWLPNDGNNSIALLPGENHSHDRNSATHLQIDRAPTHASADPGPPDLGMGDEGGPQGIPPSLPVLDPPNHPPDASAFPIPHPLPPQQRTVAKINQDRGGMAYPYGGKAKTALFAVYDGHGQGGELVSQFALHEIQRRLAKHPDFPSDQSFLETFRAVDEALRHEPLIEPLYAGTTACVVLLQDRTLTIANVGDSRAVLARRRPRKSSTNTSSPAGVPGLMGLGGPPMESEFLALPLTEDQNPDLPDEFTRISNAGGYVTASPGPGLSARVWLDATCTQIGLAMARSIGDHSVSPVGVIADPVVTRYELDDSDDFLVLASDGVWEFLESQEAVDIVAQNLDRGATKACQALIEAAAARWHDEEGEYRDDITAIVVRLPLLWESSSNGLAATAASDATSSRNVSDPNEAERDAPMSSSRSD